jgi:hypothetical protein
MTAICNAPTQTIGAARPTEATRNINISRGATQLGIRSDVFLEEDFLDAYGEIDPALGQNVIGCVLAVLACHLALGNGSLGDDQMTVCLIRRQDDRTVEVDLGIRRHRHAGRESLSLRKVAERELEN